MRRIPVILFVLALLGGCVSSQAQHAASASDFKGEPAGGRGSLEQKQAEQQKHIAELEARIGLLESEARRHRDFTQAASSPGQTVHIVPPSKHEDDLASDSTLLADDEAAGRDAPERELPRARGKHEHVPTLRLYGHAEPEPQADTLPQTSETLSVVPLPQERATGAASAPEAAGATATNDGYREALRLVRERQYDEALKVIDALVLQPSAARMLDKLLYWRGEARYAKRDYTQAKQEFETLLGRFPQSEKVPDALLKLGLCLRRLGDEAHAQAYFRRVRQEYPRSEAAAIASREGST
ncbi:MAG TPA: tetratricopeptide repeat protein [Polyangiales bacterium]